MIPKHITTAIEKWFDKSDEATFFERIVLQQEAVELHKNEPYAVRFGNILTHILTNMSVFIQDGEQIVGSVLEIIPTREEREWVESLSQEWWGDHVSLEERQRLVNYQFSPGWVKRRNPVFFSLGHLGYDWETIINKGFLWYTEKATALLESGEFDDDQDKKDFLAGAIASYKAHTAFILRYKGVAEEQALHAKDAGEQKRFTEIAKACGSIATGKATTFYEALQLIWFVVLISQKVAGCGVFNLSRMDQYLLPFFTHDVEKGILTEEEALILLIEFYHKNNEIMFPTDHMSQENEAVIKNLELAYDDPNYIIVGGLLDKHTSGVNRLSHLMVRASHLLKLKNPFLVVRWHPGIDKVFWKEVVAAMRSNATVVIYNDETMIPALCAYGVEEEDAYSYGFYGCNDPNIAGISGGLRQLWMNLVWPYELALNGGNPFFPEGKTLEDNFTLQDRIQIGLMNGPYFGKVFDEKTITSMEQFVEMYRQQMAFLLRQYRQIMEEDFSKEKEWNKGRIRIEDLFFRGTIDEATTWITGGTKYHPILIQGSGLATAIDSLAAIDIAVFKEKKYSLDHIRSAIQANYEGYEDVRAYLHKLPKFGNDIDVVDGYGKVVIDAFCDAIEAMNREKEGIYSYLPTVSTDRDFTIMGESLAASADARKQGEPISENQSPYNGADISGMTALLNSVSSLPFDRITGGPLNLRLHPTSVEGEEGLQKLSSLLEVYLKKGGMQAQLNVVGKQELLAAQEHPEQYKNLCVRVVGYAAYFVQMGKKAQDELIERTEL